MILSLPILQTHLGKQLPCLVETNQIGQPMFEEFGGDYYLQGPSFNQNVSAGTYYVKIFNANNTGKYSLAMGPIESFPPDESLKALISIPLLKEQIFGKPVTTLFFEFLGIILASGTLVLFLMINPQKSKDRENNC